MVHADEVAGGARQVEGVQSLARGLAVIRAFDEDDPELTLSEVARKVGLTRATARRFLHTLVELGYVRFDGHRFALTPRVLELGYAYLSSLTLPEVAQPHLERLSGEVRESSSVSVLDGDDVVYVARVAISRIMRVAINVGTRFPAYAASMGRVLLAGLADDELERYLDRLELVQFTPYTIRDVGALRKEIEGIRERGWALVDQELEEGLRSIAAPIRGPGDEVCAAVNVSTHTSRTGLEQLQEEFLEPLLATAERIRRDLEAASGRPDRTS